MMSNQTNKRRQLLKGIAALAISERIVSLREAWAAGQTPVAPGIYRFSGNVKVNGRPAKEGMLVSQGDTVDTGPSSEAIYVIGQDAYLQRDNSSVSIIGDASKGALRVLAGKLLGVFGKGERRILTTVATIGIRGTGCYIESEPQRVYFCLCYGTADVTPLRAPEQTETITTHHHDHPLYISAEGPTMMVPASVINHTDAELILLEGLRGRVPPFVGFNPLSSRYENNY